MDRIGIFRGKAISTMSRRELLAFAEWAGKELWKLKVEYQRASTYPLPRDLKPFARLDISIKGKIG